MGRCLINGDIIAPYHIGNKCRHRDVGVRTDVGTLTSQIIDNSPTVSLKSEQD